MGIHMASTYIAVVEWIPSWEINTTKNNKKEVTSHKNTDCS
jgi:hypothetical protein